MMTQNVFVSPSVLRLDDVPGKPLIELAAPIYLKHAVEVGCDAMPYDHRDRVRRLKPAHPPLLGGSIEGYEDPKALHLGYDRSDENKYITIE